MGLSAGIAHARNNNNMKITTKGIAAALCAGLALTAYADSNQVSPAEPSMTVRAGIIESLTRMAENDPTDATIRLKLAMALESSGMLEEAQWWRQDALDINPEIVMTGVIEQGLDLPDLDAVSRGVGGTVCAQPVGPDVIVGDLHNLHRWGTSSGLTAYSVGTTSCNVGDEWLDWFDGETRHPVISQNMYKWEPFSVGDDNGRFKQLGQSWLKHGFFALSNNICCPSCTSTNGQHLGIGCADPYNATLNGTFSELGPRSEVDGSTGIINTYPPTLPSGDVTLRGRIQVANTELDQTDPLNAASAYVVDGLYIAGDDAKNGNAGNNTSFRTISVSSSGDIHSISFLGTTQRETAAIEYWAQIEPGVTTQIVDVPFIVSGVGPFNGRFIVGDNASDNGDGTWHYEFAVYNQNAENACDGFSVPVPDGVTVSNISFHDVDSHSGEPYDNTDWTGVRNTGDVSWDAPAFSPSADRNAIRWGTLSNFGFDANTAPMTASTSLGLLDGASSPAFDVSAPSALPPCPADLNNDGLVDTADLGILIGEFGTVGVLADVNNDGGVDTADLGILIAAFGACP